MDEGAARNAGQGRLPGEVRIKAKTLGASAGHIALRLDPGAPDAHGATLAHDPPLKRPAAEREARRTLAPMLGRSRR